MPVVDLQLEAGLFIKAWVEPQGSLPKIKSPSVALFYVAARKEATADGIDVDVRLVAAKIALMEVTLQGIFPRSPTEPKSFLHLCANLSAPAHLDGVIDATGRPVRTRVHVSAHHILHRSELNEKWYGEGLSVLDPVSYTHLTLPTNREV